MMMEAEMRDQRTARALALEEETRSDRALRADRFVEDWTRHAGVRRRSTGTASAGAAMRFAKR